MRAIVLAALGAVAATLFHRFQDEIASYLTVDQARLFFWDGPAVHGWPRQTVVASAIVAVVGFALLQLLLKRETFTVLSQLQPVIVGGKVSTTSLTRPDRPGFIQCYNPATLTYLGEVKVDSAEDVKAAVERGRLHQKAWAQTSFAQRRAVLRTIKRSILAQADAIVRLSCIDTGKPRVDAQFGEIMSSCGKLDWVVAEGEAVLAPEARPTNFTSMHKVARVEYAPLGVVGVIAPWNYPFYNLYNHIASALFAGNACVLKISEYAAWSGAAYIRIARDALAAHGHSPDLVQLVQGFGETGAALVAACDKVIFTGSPGIGKAVMGGASRTLTPLVLELGGKDPFIVCDDADVDAALTLALRGTFQNAGQNCVGIERIYVHEAIYEPFVAKAREAVSRLRVGPAVAEDADGKAAGYADVDVGCITTAPQLALIQGLVDDAVAKGATLHCGGRILFAGAAGDAAAPPAPAASVSAASPSSGAGAVPSSPSAPVSRRGRGKSPSASASSAASPSRATRGGSVTSRPAAASSSTAATVNAAADPALAAAAASRYAPAVSGGLFYAPTLLTGVTHEMRIANEEVFGPVMAVFKVPRNDDAEAVRMANSTAYGLGATVFSSSPARANRIAAQLRCGMVGVNAFGLNYLVQSLPFGGVGASGFDRFAGPEGLRACCLLKSVVTDMTSAFSIPTPVPRPLQYPVAASASSFTEGLIALQFAPSLWQKVLGLARMAGLPVKLEY